MKSTKRTRKQRRSGAYLLLEVVLAITIFAFGMTSLVVGFNGRIRANAQLNVQASVQAGMEAVLREVSQLPLEEMAYESEDPETGVIYRTEMEEAALALESGDVLEDMYVLKVVATWGDGSQGGEDFIEMYVYKPE